jgi:hypothetical protein
MLWTAWNRSADMADHIYTPSELFYDNAALSRLSLWSQLSLFMVFRDSIHIMQIMWEVHRPWRGRYFILQRPGASHHFVLQMDIPSSSNQHFTRWVCLYLFVCCCRVSLWDLPVISSFLFFTGTQSGLRLCFWVQWATAGWETQRGDCCVSLVMSYDTRVLPDYNYLIICFVIASHSLALGSSGCPRWDDPTVKPTTRLWHSSPSSTISWTACTSVPRTTTLSWRGCSTRSL